MESVNTTYAKSLYEVVSEQNNTGEVLAQLLELDQVFTDNAEVYTLIATPILSKAERIEVVDQLLSGRVDTMVLNFLKVLVQNQKIGEFPKVVKQYKNLYNRDNNIEEVKVTTAKPLSEFQREKLLLKLKTETGKEIELTEQIDPGIMGGLILNLENTELNASVKEKLNDISRHLRA